MDYNMDKILEDIGAALKGAGITTTSTLGATILNPEQLEKFVRTMQLKATLLPRYRLQVMRAPKLDIDKIAFTSRIMGVPAAEGEAKPDTEWIYPEFSMHQLSAERMQGIVSIADETLRSNIERANLMDTIMTLIAERVGLDIEEQAVNGDTGSGDAFLALNVGWLKGTRRRVPEKTNIAYDDGAVPSFTTGAGETTKSIGYPKLPITGSTFELFEDNTTVPPGVLVAHDDGAGVIVDDGGSGVAGTIDYNSGVITLTGLTAATAYAVKYTAVGFDKTASAYPENMFRLMTNVIPRSYFTKPSEWEICVPWEVLTAYRDVLKARYSTLGDTVQVNGEMTIPWEGLTIRYVPTMPVNKAWLTHPANTLYGVLHEVEIETEREAKAKRTDVIVDAQTDYAFEEPEATVVADIT